MAYTGHHPRQRTFTQSSKLQDVLYEIRGPVHDHAARLEAEGHRILKLNIGNPAPFGFEAPDVIMRDMIQALPYAQGYSDSKGIMTARRAVFTRYELVDGFPRFDVDDVYLGNGASELITMTLQALLDNGDQVLIPAPDYPLWTASHLAGRRHAGALPVRRDAGLDARHRRPGVEDHRPHQGDRRDQPEQPDRRGVHPRNPHADGRSRAQAPAAAAGRRDLRQDPLRRRQAHRDGVGGAGRADPDLQRVVEGLPGRGLPVGLAGRSPVPRNTPSSFIEGISLLANMRLCPNVPAQHAIQVALGGHQSIEDLVLPGGRLLEQRDVAWTKLNEIPGVSCVKPEGALYAFPRLDPEVYDIQDDEQLVLDLLLQEKILVTQGTGFNWPTPDHLRIVTLPWSRDLANAIERLGNFLSSYRQ